VSSSRHLDNRKNEALGYGLLPPAIGRATALTAAVQTWLAGYLRTVHVRLATWAARCLPADALVYLPAMPLAGCAREACVAATAAALARTLRLDDGATRRAVRAFVNASHTAVLQARNASSRARRPLLIADDRAELLRWPPDAQAAIDSCSC